MSFPLPYPYQQIIRWTPDSSALTFLDRCEGVYNIWKQTLDPRSPTQITHFTEDAIFHYDWLDDGHLIVSRGAKTRDIVLIRDFE